MSGDMPQVLAHHSEEGMGLVLAWILSGDILILDVLPFSVWQRHGPEYLSLGTEILRREVETAFAMLDVGHDRLDTSNLASMALYADVFVLLRVFFPLCHHRQSGKLA
jgi:hypothetical protein